MKSLPLLDAPPVPAGGARRRVLIVDDHPAMSVSLRFMLAPEHEVQTAISAEAALELLSTQRFDLVLCDVMMPGMSGMDLYARLRAENPSQAEQFVFMTGGATSPATAHFLEASKRPVLEKPFRPEALTALLTR